MQKHFSLVFSTLIISPLLVALLLSASSPSQLALLVSLLTPLEDIRIESLRHHRAAVFHLLQLQFQCVIIHLHFVTLYYHFTIWRP